ncbi:phosphoadenosine phosphosulfate reductase family protein [Bradyrhizobium sp. RDT46]|uniref:phosphoadenosine phosphosulfate reductase domain-containing protein n=1 Tax=Bradyrhizobium sp. RDT46 TaxID=3341829 RepID=UPI0035C7504E
MSFRARKEKIFSSLPHRNYRIFASKRKVAEMHLLKDNSASVGVSSKAPLARPGSQEFSADVAPSMDHLDQLEAQSIYIFREAFARLKKIALLWSLGKDSNVMIWLARKAFFGKMPFPALHVDTGKKFPEMYRFPRSLRQRVGSRSARRALPAHRCRRSDIAAGRPLRRAKDRGPQDGARQVWLRRSDRRHPPRRGSDPRQGARVLAARP